jgi:hypothetical protein
VEQLVTSKWTVDLQEIIKNENILLVAHQAHTLKEVKYKFYLRAEVKDLVEKIVTTVDSFYILK